ncbi:MAG: transposase [Actinobacteria bacterium]|nr:transposase [Actinomycetota bacterium]
MRTELRALNDALPGLPWLRITDRKSGAIQLTALDAQPEPRNLRRLKKAVRERWGQVPLIDMVTEAALRTGMLGQLTAISSREALQRSVLWERLLLVAYSYGTNMGILADATFAARDPAIWGHSTTTVASDSTHFRACDQNLFTEWHSALRRPRGADLLARREELNTLMLQDILAEPTVKRAHRRRPTWPDRAVLGARPTVRRDHAQPDQSPGPQHGRHD